MLNLILKLIFGDYNKRKLKKIYPLVENINRKENHYQSMNHEDLANQILNLKQQLQDGKTLEDILVDTFALISVFLILF